MKRRDFLKTAGLASLALAFPARALAASFAEPGSRLLAKRWAMVIDTRAMASPGRLQTVITACHAWHNVPSFTGPQEVKWIWAAPYGEAFPEQALDLPPKTLADRPIPLLCNHCENPPCVRVCPTGATFKRADGIVAMDYHRCIGCRSCMSGCPYGARSFNFTDPQPYVDAPNMEYPMRTRGVVEKCTFCPERLALGQEPYCVAASGGALVFGDLLDPEDPLRRMLAARPSWQRKAHLGTGPAVFYVL